MQRTESFRRATRFSLMLLGVLGVGVLGYSTIEGWPVFDSLYMTVITLAGVGYGEVHPLDGAGRAFTMVLILGGLSVLVYAITQITSFIVEGEMSGLLKRRKIMRQIDGLTDHFIICGAGRSGRHVLYELQQTGRPFVGIEQDPAKVERFRGDDMLILQGDATDEELLKQAGIERAAGLVAALPDDKDNLFVVITARGMNPRIRIVSRIQDVYGREKFIRSGANAIVSTNFIGGLRMASELVRPATTTFLDQMLKGNATLRVEDVPIGATTPYRGKPIVECDALAESGVVLVSLVRDTETVFNPPRAHVLQSGETLVVIGTPDQLGRLRSRLSV